MAMVEEYMLALQEVCESRFDLAIGHLQLVARLLSSERLEELVRVKSSSERLAFLNDWFGKFIVSEVKNIIVVMAEHNDLNLLSAIISSDFGVGKNAIVTVAKAISASEEANLRKRLLRDFDVHTARVVIDPSILGGIKIRIGDREADYSIASKLTDFAI